MTKKRVIVILSLTCLIIAYLYFFTPLIKNLISRVSGASSLRAGDLTIGDTAIVVEVADTQEKRALGLSNRQSLDRLAGMLFIFPKEGQYEFWMKDMNFPLDEIWMNKDWKIVDIYKNFRPETYPASVTSREPAMYALEVNAGFVEAHKVKIGDIVKYDRH